MSRIFWAEQWSTLVPLLEKILSTGSIVWQEILQYCKTSIKCRVLNK